MLTIGKIHGVSFKKRAPRAIKEIKAFATQAMVRFPSHQGRRRTTCAAALALGRIWLTLHTRVPPTSAWTPS
jgi:hypothetical protein